MSLPSTPRLPTMIRRLLLRGLAATAPVLLAATPLLAQDDRMGMSGLGRPYWHVFAAYAITLVLIGGWVVSIARRLGRLERRLGEPEA